MTRTTDPFATAMRRLRDAGLYPVRGGAPDEGAPDEKGATTVDGDPITHEELQEIRNRRGWKARQHEADERLKERERELEHRTETSRAAEREAAALRAEIAELRGASRGTKDNGPQLPDYPENPVDDPDGWRRVQSEREAALRNELRELRSTVERLSGRVDETGRSVASTVNGSAAFNRVAAHNERLFEDFATKRSLSVSETDELKRHVNAFRVEGRGYGQYAEGAVSPDGRQIWEYTPTAIEKAYRAAFEDKYESEIAERVKKEIGSRAPGRANGQPQALRFGENGVPAKDAPPQALHDYFYSLPPKSQAAQRFMDDLPLPVVKQILQLHSEQEAMEEGSPSPMGGSPIGVQDSVVDIVL